MTPALVLTVLLALCGPLPGTAADEMEVLRIVKQPGLGYLQLIVMREFKLLEKRLPSSWW